jgi:hypothetical protein
VGDGCKEYADLSDARIGECVAGASCGCGAADNRNYIGALSNGQSADEACCACKGSCGGTYDVAFTPVIQGDYTVLVMLGHTLEVQNISTAWASLAQRAGYFTLSYGDCGNTVPCPRTKQLAWNSDGEAVRSALAELPGIGEIEVGVFLPDN